MDLYYKIQAWLTHHRSVDSIYHWAIATTHHKVEFLIAVCVSLVVMIFLYGIISAIWSAIFPARAQTVPKAPVPTEPVPVTVVVPPLAQETAAPSPTEGDAAITQGAEADWKADVYDQDIFDLTPDMVVKDGDAEAANASESAEVIDLSQHRTAVQAGVTADTVDDYHDLGFYRWHEGPSDLSLFAPPITGGLRAAEGSDIISVYPENMPPADNTVDPTLFPELFEE